MKKVCSDIETSFADCHRQLLEELLDLFPRTDSRGRQSLGYCLSTIASFLPSQERREVQKSFITSKFKTVRRRGYKSISFESEAPADLLRAAWDQNGDTECGWLIVKTFPVEFLIQHRVNLVSALSEGWQLARLYLRIAESDPELLDELRAIDEISYCYVLAKLGRALSVADAVRIVDRNAEDDRLGLLVWSLGRLQMWDALRHVEAQLPEIQERRIIRLRSKYGR